jgi:hypothetical protein
VISEEKRLLILAAASALIMPNRVCGERCRCDVFALPLGVLQGYVRDQGRTGEWYVDLLKSLQHFTFEFVSGFHHSIVFLLPAFSLAWLKAIWSVGDSMSCDSVEQLLVRMESLVTVTVALHGDQLLKRFQCLHSSFEAD